MGWRKKEEITESIQTQTQTPINNEIEVIKQKLANLEQPRQVSPITRIQAKERTEVVKELPMQPLRKYKDENGDIVNLITIEEALNLIVNS